jgi:hypothetical protein
MQENPNDPGDNEGIIMNGMKRKTALLGVALVLLAGTAMAISLNWSTAGTDMFTIQYPSRWTVQKMQETPPSMNPTMQEDLEALLGGRIQLLASYSVVRPIFHLTGRNGEDVIVQMEAVPHSIPPGSLNSLSNYSSTGFSKDGVNKERLVVKVGESGVGLLLMKAPIQMFDQVNSQVFTNMSKTFTVQ